MDLGSLRIDPVIDGEGRFRPTNSFRGTTDEQWDAHRGLLDSQGRLPFAIGGFLVRGGGRTVLVDAGGGTERIMGIQCGLYLESLSALGLSTDAVTDVVFTHLHSDHIGWASSDGSPVFANATYRCSAADWEHFTVTRPGAEATRLAPLAGHLETWPSSGGALVPGFDALPAPGHTPGSTVVVVSSGAERAMLLGDVVHCPVQLVDDEWAGMFDVDARLARETRNALARELEGSGLPIAAAHFPGLRFGRLIRAEGRRQWVV